jgi:hypothetical protein
MPHLLAAFRMRCSPTVRMMTGIGMMLVFAAPFHSLMHWCTRPLACPALPALPCQMRLPSAGESCCVGPSTVLPFTLAAACLYALFQVSPSMLAVLICPIPLLNIPACLLPPSVFQRLHSVRWPLVLLPCFWDCPPFPVVSTCGCADIPSILPCVTGMRAATCPMRAAIPACAPLLAILPV